MIPHCFQIQLQDNVATLIEDAPAGPVQLVGTTECLAALEHIASGHKIALCDIAVNEAVIKFGGRIGHATQPIRRGAWVHLHNLASDFDQRSGSLDLYSGTPTDTGSAYV